MGDGQERSDERCVSADVATPERGKNIASLYETQVLIIITDLFVPPFRSALAHYPSLITLHASRLSNSLQTSVMIPAHYKYSNAGESR
jgi:hypothetical protein